MIDLNPIAFQIFGLEIHWYSLILLIGFLVGSFFVMMEAKRLKISKDYIFNLLFWVIIMGILGARIYYVIFNWDIYGHDLLEIFKIWNGGLAIHGGLIFGFVTVILYTKKYKVNTFTVSDMMVGPLLLAQAIGRWGNLFNGEAHGGAVDISHLTKLHIPQFIIDGMNIGGIYYAPTFLYESLWCLLGFIILFVVKRYKYLHIGQLTCLYAMWYGIGRFFIEKGRTDSLMMGNFKAAQIMSIVMIVVALIIFMILSRKGKFEDLYNEQMGEINF